MVPYRGRDSPREPLRQENVLRLRFWIAVTATLVSSQAAHASLSDYLAARASYPPRAGITLSAVQADAAKYRNAVIELRGVVNGVSRADAYCNILIRLTDSQTALIHGSRDAVLPDSGEAARALVTVQGDGDLSLVCIVTEGEIGDRQIDPLKAQPKPAAAVPATGLPTKWPVPSRNRSSFTSRGLIDPGVFLLYQQVVEQFNPRLSAAQAELISRNIVQSSYAQGVDARLIMAIFATESRFKINARSRTGAMGLGQLMPRTARSLGVSNAWDPQQNIQGAVRLIQQHWISYAAKTQDFRKVFQLVCAAYNAGPGAVKKYGGVPPYRETRNYVKKVATWYKVFAPELFRG
jgi:hypothetical protein